MTTDGPSLGHEFQPPVNSYMGDWCNHDAAAGGLGICGRPKSEHGRTDAQREERAKERGRSVAAGKNAVILAMCRQLVEELLQREPTVDVDRVRAELVARRIPFESGNWMGSIFVGLGLRIVGYRKCSHRKGHSRMISVWGR